MLFETAGPYLVYLWSLGDVVSVVREDLTGVSFFKVLKLRTEKLGDFPRGSVVKTALPVQQVWVQALLEEISCMP